MLKVLHVGKFYPPVRGGMERVVHSLCATSRGRLESSVLAFNDGSSTVVEDVDGVRVTRTGTWARAGSVPIAPALAAHLGRARADVVVLHEPNPWALVACHLTRPRVPTAIWFHSEVVRSRMQYRLFYAPVARAVYGRARRFLVSSPPLARADALAPYSDRIRVIPFGVDGARPPDAGTAARAAALRTAHPGLILLFAGRLVGYKGLDVLIDAVAPLDATLLVVGDGPMRAEWTRRAATSRGAARIVFKGSVPDDVLAAHFMASDVLVLPSVTRAEAFGFVQLEAMAYGKPVISTALPTGVPWVNQHGRTGLVVPPGDREALRAAIARLARDAELRQRLGAAGAERVGREFTTAAMADRFVAACYEIAERDGRSAV